MYSCIYIQLFVVLLRLMIKRGFTSTESYSEMPQSLSLSLLLSRSLIRSFPSPEAIWLPITSRSVTPCTTERSRHTISNRNGLWITHPSDRASLCPLSYLLNNCSGVPRDMSSCPGIAVYDFYTGTVQDGTAILTPCSVLHPTASPRQSPPDRVLLSSDNYPKYTPTHANTPQGSSVTFFCGIGPVR